MSRFFPHPAYAEDQPLHHTILTVHVLTRAVTAGSIVGAGVFGARDLYQRVRSRTSPPPAAAMVPRTQLLLRSAGVGSAVAVGLLSLGLVGRMWGREEIEWRDRSWRLLENKGQMETDDWTYDGAIAGLGAAAAMTKGGLANLGWKGALGAAGTGTVAGTVGYMVWRYGIHKGKFSN